MYSDILRRIAGVEVFPVISLVLFVAVFTVVLVWTVRLDASRVVRESRLPLDEAAPSDALPAAERSIARRDA